MRAGMLMILILVQSVIFAQLPETDIYIADIEIKNNLVKIKKAENLTPHKGYDNQPFFRPDGKSLLYSSETGTDKKIHICQADLKSNAIVLAHRRDALAVYEHLTR